MPKLKPEERELKAGRMAAELAEAIGYAVEKRYVSHVQGVEKGDRVYTMQFHRPPSFVAREICKRGMSGQFIATPTGLVWRVGRLRGGNLIDTTDDSLPVLMGYWDRRKQRDPAPPRDDRFRGTEEKGDWVTGARQVVAQFLGDAYLSRLDAEQEEGGNIADLLGRYKTASDKLLECHKASQAQIVAAELAAEELIRDTWSIGGCARILWKYIAEPDPSPRTHRSPHEQLYGMQPDGEYAKIGHYHCTPGMYGTLRLYDVSAYYGTLLRRAAEEGRLTLRPRIYWEGGKPLVDRGDWREGERERLAEVMAAIWHIKPLRNSMWGAALGTDKPLFAYSSNKEGGYKETAIRPGPGPHRPLALIIARSAQDLTAEQCVQSEAVYAAVDSVGIAEERAPELWKKYGFKCSGKAFGTGEISGVGSWGVWPSGKWKPEDWDKKYWVEYTDPYAAGHTSEPTELRRKNYHLYKQWL